MGTRAVGIMVAAVNYNVHKHHGYMATIVCTQKANRAHILLTTREKVATAPVNEAA